MPKLEKYKGLRIYADRIGGAVLREDKNWYPFVYFTDGELDVFEDLCFADPETAFEYYKKIFT